MAKFIDAEGSEWTIEISVAEIKQLRTQLSVDLLALMDDNGRLLKRLAADPILLVDVISELCTAQITERGLDEYGFARRLVGAGLSNAMDGLIDAIANFTPPQRGAIIRQAWTKAQEMEQTVMDRVSQQLASPDLNQRLEAKIAVLLQEAGS